MIQSLQTRPPTVRATMATSTAWRSSRAGGPSLLDSRPSFQHHTAQVNVRVPALREVLVPLDGSTYAEHALPWAIHIAELADAQVRLVHVHEQMIQAFHGRRPERYREFDQLLRGPKEEYLADIMQRLAQAGTPPIKPMFLEGRHVTDTLADLTLAADITVMASRRRSRLNRLLFGSVSQAVLRETSTPMLLTRGYRCPVDLTARPRLRHALVPLDGSPEGEDILKPTAALSQLTGGHQTLLRVVPETLPLSLDSMAPGNPLAELNDVARRWAADLPHLRTSLVWSNAKVATEVLQRAREQETDFIGLVTRRRGPLQRVLQPGLADYLIRCASVPVLVVTRQFEKITQSRK